MHWHSEKMLATRPGLPDVYPLGSRIVQKKNFCRGVKIARAT
jgi:hypothetical protein